MRQAGVVERAHLLGHPGGAATQVGDEPGGELALLRARGEPEGGAGQAVEVDLGPGEGHRRVDRQDLGADRTGRLEDRQAVPAGGVGDVLPRTDRARGGHRGHDVVEHVVRDGEQQQVAGARDVGGLEGGDARQQRGDPRAGGVGLTGGGHDVVGVGGCAAERGGEDGADASGADDTHPQGAQRVIWLNLFRSRPADHPARQVPAREAGVGTGLLGVFNVHGTQLFRP